MNIDTSLAKFGLAVVEIDDLIAILDHADLYTHWYGPGVTARSKIVKIINSVNEARSNG